MPYTPQHNPELVAQILKYAELKGDDAARRKYNVSAATLYALKRSATQYKPIEQVSSWDQKRRDCLVEWLQHLEIIIEETEEPDMQAIERLSRTLEKVGELDLAFGALFIDDQELSTARDRCLNACLDKITALIQRCPDRGSNAVGAMGRMVERLGNLHLAKTALGSSEPVITGDE